MDSFNATFYTLVSLDTEEMKFAEQRQRHLVDVGFFFEVIQELPFMKNQKEKEKLILSSEKEQNDFLIQIGKAKEDKDMAIEQLNGLEKDKDLIDLEREYEQELGYVPE
jgi:hypothetical protein